LVAATFLWLESANTAFAQSESELSQHARLAQAAIQSNNNVAAESELNAMLRLDPANVDAHANLGMLKFVEAKYQEASNQFEAALSRAPSLWSAQAFLGLCEARLGNPVRSQQLLEASVPHLKDWTLLKQASLELVALYSNSGSIEKAVPILQTLTRLRPSDPEVLYTKYRIHSEIASGALREMAAGGNDSPWLHEVYGQNFMAQEQYAWAVIEFQKALELGPQLPGLHYQLGEALLFSERTETKRAAAEEQFRLELAGDPQNVDCILKLGEIAAERSQIEEAKSLISRALVLRPSSATAHVAEASLMEREGNVTKAITELEVAEKLAPDVKQTHYRLGALYRKEGRKEDADRQLQIFQRLASAEPTPVRVTNQLQ
jgi:tetratricopeptide (TPR) repeat protein